MTLSALLNDTSVLLNDQNYSFTSKPQLVRFINEARRNAAKRTGCVRRLITGQSAFGASAQPGMAIPGAAQPGSLPGAFPATVTSSTRTPGSGGAFGPAFGPAFAKSKPGFQKLFAVAGAVQNSCMTIPGVERYPYQGFFVPYMRAMYAGTDQIYDTITCSVNWGGTNRPTLDWMPWDNFQAYCRAYAVLNTSYPSVWSVYNDGPQGEIWMFPVPSIAGEIELDVFASPAPLIDDDSYDVIPDGFQEALKYKAACLAFMSSQRYAQAQMMEDQFADDLGIARVAVDRGKTASYYYSNI